MVTIMTTSRSGRLFIACREAIVEVPYQDGDHLSIGCGHNGPDVQPGDRVTTDEALRLFAGDLASRERDVNRMLKLPVAQNRFDALVSLHYNRGNRDFPDMIAAVNSGYESLVAALFPTLDTNSKGEHLPGLKTRRLAEREMYLTANYGPLDSIPWWKDNPHKTHRFEYAVQPTDLQELS